MAAARKKRTRRSASPAAALDGGWEAVIPKGLKKRPTQAPRPNPSRPKARKNAKKTRVKAK